MVGVVVQPGPRAFSLSLVLTLPYSPPPPGTHFPVFLFHLINANISICEIVCIRENVVFKDFTLCQLRKKNTEESYGILQEYYSPAL